MRTPAPAASWMVQWGGDFVGQIEPQADGTFVAVAFDGTRHPARRSISAARADLIAGSIRPSTELAIAAPPKPDGIESLLRVTEAGIEVGGRVVDPELARRLWLTLGSALGARDVPAWAALLAQLDREFRGGVPVTGHRPDKRPVHLVAIVDDPRTVRVRVGDFAFAVLRPHGPRFRGPVLSAEPGPLGPALRLTRRHVGLHADQVAQLAARPLLTGPVAEAAPSTGIGRGKAPIGQTSRLPAARRIAVSPEPDPLLATLLELLADHRVWTLHALCVAAGTARRLVHLSLWRHVKSKRAPVLDVADSFWQKSPKATLSMPGSNDAQARS